jgi:hypothetical protein
MEVQGDVATWRGELGVKRVFDVRFQRGFFGRVWTRVWGFLDTPVGKL